MQKKERKKKKDPRKGHTNRTALETSISYKHIIDCRIQTFALYHTYWASDWQKQIKFKSFDFEWYKYETHVYTILKLTFKLENLVSVTLFYPTCENASSCLFNA